MADDFEQERLANVQTFLDQQSASQPVTPVDRHAGETYGVDYRPQPVTPDEPRIGTAGSICKCGLAKSYHPRLADHEYEPRYASQPVTRGQEADAAWEALIAEVTQGYGRADAFDKHRPLIEAALRGQVREGIATLNIPMLNDALHVAGFGLPTSRRQRIADFGLREVEKVAAEYDRLQGLSGGQVREGIDVSAIERALKYAVLDIETGSPESAVREVRIAQRLLQGLSGGEGE